MSHIDAKDLRILELEQLVREQEQRIGELETFNKSERELRGCVIARKLSYGSKREQGLRLMERVWTVT